MQLLLQLTHLGLAAATFVHAGKGGPSFDPKDYGDNCVIKRDVAVIGGGASGTYGAVNILDKGKSVVLVEALSRLGGHENSYTDPATGVNVDYGVMAYTNNSAARDYFTRLKVPYTGFTFGGGSTVYADFETGDALTDFTLDTNVGNYAEQLAKYPYLVWGWDLPDPVPDDLLLPFGEFAKKYSLGDSVYFIYSNSDGISNPPYLQQPTVNIFKYVNQNFLNGMRNGILTTAQHDNGLIYEAAEKVLGPNVLLSSTVVASKRPADGSKGSVQLVVETPYGRKLIIASQLLISIPLTISNMEPFDLNSHEKRLFNKFGYSSYYTGLLRYSGFPNATRYVNVGPNTDYHIPELPSAYTITPTAVDGLYYYWFTSPVPKTQSEIQTYMAGLVRRLAKCEKANPEFVTLAVHTPFQLNVPASDIKAGFYSQLNGLQGGRNTWYTGAAVEAHSSGDLFNFTQALVPKIVNGL